MRVGLVRESDWYESRTGTRVGLVRESDWYESRTGIRVGLVQEIGLVENGLAEKFHTSPTLVPVRLSYQSESYTSPSLSRYYKPL
jgi:hypothetical protein